MYAFYLHVFLWAVGDASLLHDLAFFQIAMLACGTILNQMLVHLRGLIHPFCTGYSYMFATFLVLPYICM